LITANSPGEIAGWTRPLVMKIKEKSPTAKVTVLLLPCAFSSGREYEAASSLEGVDRVFKVKETISLLYSRKKADFDKESRLVHLGGDLFYAAMISGKYKIPAWAYEWAQKKWDGRFVGYFARDEKNREILLGRKIPAEKITVVGDLLVDSVRDRGKNVPQLEKFSGLTITFMPGSRLKESCGLVPFFAGTAELILQSFPDSRFYIPISPFIDKKKLKEASPFKPLPDFSGVEVRYDGERFVTEGGLEIFAPRDSLAPIRDADFVVSIPGTSTGEAGALGTPAYCILPLNRVEDIPFVGVIGMLNLIPLVGRPLKRALMYQVEKKFGLLAQPNLRAGREIIPETRMVITPEKMFELIRPYLENPGLREIIRNDLKKLYDPLGGAAERMADAILS
jgi:hypothetical protein